MERLKTITIWTLSTLLIRNLLEEDFPKEEMKVAILDFVFKSVDLKCACIFLFALSVIIPSLILFYLLNDLYKQQSEAKRKVKRLFARHLSFTYYTVVIIYLFSLSKNKNAKNSIYKALLNSQLGLIAFTKSHNYLLYLFLTPPFFIDAVYSIEVEKIKAKNIRNNIKDNPYSKFAYFIGQFFLIFYLIYASVVIVKTNSKLPIMDLLTLNCPNEMTKIAGYSSNLISGFAWCIFIVLTLGLVDCYILQHFNL